MAKASFVTARGFGTEVVILNGLCRDRLSLQCCASAVPLCRVLSHAPLPAVQTWTVLRTVTISRQKTSLSMILESVCQTRSRPNLCLQWKKWKWAVPPGLPPLPPSANPCSSTPCSSQACYTSGSCKSLQLPLVQGDSAASGGVCNRNSGITCFPDPRGKQVCSSLSERDERQLYGDMTAKNSLNNPLNEGINFMKAFTSPLLHVLVCLPLASYPTLNWQFRMSLGDFWNGQEKSNSCLLELLTEWPEGHSSRASFRGHTKRGQGKPFQQPDPRSSGWN